MSLFLGSVSADGVGNYARDVERRELAGTGYSHYVPGAEAHLANSAEGLAVLVDDTPLSERRRRWS